MHISTLGMSNIGKSYLSQRLQLEHGFERFECDKLIETALAPELEKNGYKGIDGVAAWMGQPYDPNYAERSARYLQLEKEVMLEVFTKLKTLDKPAVVDTTGSVIYTGSDVTKTLQELTRVVYLKADFAHVNELFEKYLKEPKPVIWADSYSPREGETNIASLSRCYRNLLQFRAQKYHELAELTLEFAEHRSPKFKLKRLFSESA